MQIEKYIADKITSLCEKRDISKYRLSQLSGISQSSLGRIMAQENLPSLITLRKTERSSRDMERSEYK